MAGKTIVEEFVAVLGWEIDSDQMEKFRERGDKVKQSLKKIVTVTAAATSALTGFLVVVNRGTAETAALAKSVGISVNDLQAITDVIKPLGFGLDNVVDLIEEMNNKFGESKGLGEQMTAVKEAVQILGLEFNKIKDLSPEEQFKTLLQAAQDMEDQQKAVSAIDMLMGGEGNKIVGFLRTIKGSISEIIEKRKELNFLSKDGIAGAERWNAALGNARTIVTSLAAEGFGLLGEMLAPFLENLVEWTKQNKKLIKTELVKWVKDLSDFMLFVYGTLKGIIGLLGAAIQKVGGLKNAVQILAVVYGTLTAIRIGLWLNSFITLVKDAITFVGGLTGVIKGLKIALIGLKWLAIFALLFLVIEDIVTMLRGGESVVGDMSKEFEKLLDSADEFWADVFDVESGEEFRRLWVGFLTDIYDGIIGIGEAIAEFFTKTIPDTFNDFVTWSEELFTKKIPELVEGALQIIEHFFPSLGKSIREAIDDAIRWVEQRIGDLVSILPKSVRDFMGLKTPEEMGGGKRSGSPKRRPAAPGAPGGFLEPPPVSDFFSGVNEGAANFFGAPAVVPAGNTITNANQYNSVENNFSINPRIVVNEAAAQDPKKMRDEIGKAIGEEVSKAVRNNQTGVNY